MATENRNFGTFGRDGKRRENLTLIEARNEVKDDRNDGVISEVVLLIPPLNFIDDTFKDDVVALHTDLQSANARLAAVQQIIDAHSKGYNSVSDEVYETNAVCAECNRSFPCEIRTDLESALR